MTRPTRGVGHQGQYDIYPMGRKILLENALNFKK